MAIAFQLCIRLRYQEGSGKPIEVERESSPKVERESSPKVERESSPKVERESSPKFERESSPKVERESSPKVERESSLSQTVHLTATYSMWRYQMLYSSI